MKPLPLSRLLLPTLFLLAVPSAGDEQSCDDPVDSDGNGDSTCASPDPTITARTTPASFSARLPPDYLDPCTDAHIDCPTWTLQGECRANPAYMLPHCAKSCGACVPLADALGGSGADDGEGAVGARGGGGGALAGHCGDDRDGCPGWAAGGECAVNPTFMRQHCKYSCWLCVDAARDRRLGVDEGVIARKLRYAEMDTGKHQWIRPIDEAPTATTGPMTPEDRAGITSALRRMDQYARYDMTEPSANGKARERCRNRHRMCAEWAYRGDCPMAGIDDDDGDGAAGVGGNATGDRAVFMMDQCPLACRRCHYLPSFHKCVGRRPADSKPAWRAGGLKVLFEGIGGATGREGWAAYGPVFVSHPDDAREGTAADPYVAVLQNFLSDEEANDLLALGGAIGWTRRGTGPGPYEGADCRSNIDLCQGHEIYQRVMRRISGLALAERSRLEPMELASFVPGAPREGRLRHNYDVDGAWTPAGPRFLSLVVFLSDGRSVGGKGREDVGGGIGFPYLDWLRVRPRKGLAVLFPNVVDDDLLRPDRLTAFEHFPVSEGADGPIVVASTHVRLYNWTDASLRGCV